MEGSRRPQSKDARCQLLDLPEGVLHRVLTFLPEKASLRATCRRARELTSGIPVHIKVSHTCELN